MIYIQTTILFHDGTSLVEISPKEYCEKDMVDHLLLATGRGHEEVKHITSEEINR